MNVAVRRLLWGGVFILTFVAVYQLVMVIMTAQNTGVLEVSASSTSAWISISQDSRQAKVIGVGTARARVAPGNYLLAATDAGRQVVTVVSVGKKTVTNKYLNLSGSSGLASVDNIQFENMDALINSGITTTQINILRQDFYNFNHSAKTVSVIADSVAPGPHNPDVDTSFTMSFGVAVDSNSYSAVIKYSGADSVQLSLFDSRSNIQVYDSGSTAQAGN